jgi:DNA-binding transcriptional ArsR family regulator
MVEEKHESSILKFSCSCINSLDDPWSYVSRSGSLSSETRQIIINKIYKEPKTVTQLAKEIGLSQPAIHKHVVELLNEGLIKEVEVPESDRAFKREKYYSPTFPVILKSDLSILEPILREIVDEVAEVIKKNEDRLKGGFDRTSLPKRQWTFEDLTFFLYRKITDLTREKFEREGFFPEIPVRNGEKWIFWAEEVDVEENINLSK